MKSRFLIPLLALAVIAGACNKDLPAEKKGRMKDLVVHSDFEWNTSTTIEVSIKGIPSDRDFFATLYLKDVSGNVFLKSNHSMRDDLNQKVTVPVTVDELVLEYGHRRLTSSIANGKVSFTFIQKDNANDYSDN